MSLRTWSFGGVLGAGFAWAVVMLVIVMPYVTRWIETRQRDQGSAEWSGVGFLPYDLVIGFLIAVVPPLLLLVAWALTRWAGRS